MNADIINAVKAAIENTTAPEVPDGPVRFKSLAVEKIGEGDTVLRGFNPESGASIRIDDPKVLKELIELGAKPGERNTVEVDTDDGPVEVVRRRIDGFAIEAVITSLTRKTSKSGKIRISASVKDIKVVKSGLVLEGDWAL